MGNGLKMSPHRRLTVIYNPLSILIRKIKIKTNNPTHTKTLKCQFPAQN